MPDTSNISIGLIGMNNDLSPTNLSEKHYLYCLNGVIENYTGNGFGNLQNDVSNILAIKLPDGFKIIGHAIVLEQNRAIVLLANDNGLSIIADYKDCNYTSKDYIFPTEPCTNCGPYTLLTNSPIETSLPYCDLNVVTTSDCLNLNINYPVDIEYKITDCGLNIYFTDALNERRFLYFDYENGNSNDNLKINNKFLVVSGFDSTNCEIPIYTNILDCNKIKYHPEYSNPTIELIDVVNGGQLKSGVYQAIIAYSDVLGNELTSYSNSSNPIPLRTKNITISTDYNTNLAIKFKILNLDKTNLFKYYNLVIAETVDNFTEFKLVGTYPVYTTEHTYGGNNLSKKLSPSDVFFKRPFYKTAKSVTKANDYLFFTELAEFPKFNLQPYAEMIKLYWETIAIKESVYTDPKNTTNYRGYLRDEVYPFGLVLSASNGEELCVIHIPGPSKEYLKTNYLFNVDEIINTNDVIADTSCDPSPRNKRWQVYNTANVLYLPHEITTECSDPKIWEYGEFSYHESTENYPNNPTIWGKLCGKPIRHFKFPDSTVTHIHDGLNDGKLFADNNLVFPIGVRIENQSVKDMLQYALSINAITVEQFNRVHNYRLVRGNRVGNKSIEAKGLLYDVWDYDKNNKKYYYSNYPYNDLRPDNFISNTNDTYTVADSDILDSFKNKFRPSGRYTFHSPDTSFTNPRIGTELKLETLEYGESEGYFNECESQSRFKFLSVAATTIALTSGIAEALSKSRDKECTSYTRSSPVITTGTTGIPITSGTNPGATITIPGVAPLAINAQANTLPFFPYDKDTGEQFPVIPVLTSSVTHNTCRGNTFQELNKPISVLSLLTGAYATGFAGLPSIGGILYQLSLGLTEMKKVSDLIEALIPYINFFIQYNSIGKYNNYKVIPNNVGNKRRLLDSSAYLDTQVQSINEEDTSGNPSTIHFNNWNRESSVYLKIQIDHSSKLFPNPSVVDNSRFTLGKYGVGGDYKSMHTRYKSKISSYYGSIKNYVPDQYGNIFKIEYVETGKSTLLNSTSTNIVAFGGDTFITRFALKRKMPFFLRSTFKLPDESDIRMTDIGNVGYPNYYLVSGGSIVENVENLNFIEILNPSNVGRLFGTPANRLDVDVKPFFYQKGKVHLYNYGIPYFLVESDVNTDYRHGNDNKDTDFYPHQKDLDFWLQEKNVPITVDNKYIYNNTFSKQNKESFICVNNAEYAPDKICKSEFPSRVIYSEQNENNGSTYDNWLVFKANNYKDFPLTNGKLITADGIEDDKIIVRFENTTSVFSAYNTIQTDSTNIQVGTGGLFVSRPKNFSSTSLGYAGSQHRSLLKTEYGHIWADARRGQVFLLQSGGQGLDEISKDGMKNWFKENLPFTINKYFPNINVEDLDNNYKGLGLHMSFDKRFNRLLLTKLDYKPIVNEIFYKDKDFYTRVYLPDTTTTTTTCPTGYTLSGGNCVRNTYIPATVVSSNIYNIASSTYNVYGISGTVIYSTFNADGTGTFTPIPLTNPFWTTPYIGSTSPATDVGPVNRISIWTNDGLTNYVPGAPDRLPLNVWVGFSVCLNIITSKVYYVAIAADNNFRISSNGVILLESNATTMATNHGTDQTVVFKKLHIYPISLNAGANVIKVEGSNYGAKAGFGCEIFDNTPSEISSALAYSSLNVVFTTRNQTTFSNTVYSCPTGFVSSYQDCTASSCIGTVTTAPINITTTTKNFKDTKVELTNPNYFCNKSWTLSYNFYTKSWVSFHSFTPNVYMDWIEYFQTSNQSNIYSHSLVNDSYQIYNGVLQPFIIELISKPEMGKSFLTNISFMLDTIKYNNRIDTFYDDVINFNKVIVYNNKQCSGLLNLVVSDPEDFTTIGKYPKRVNNGIEVETHSAEGLWSVNDIYDVTHSNYDGKSMFLNNCANSYKELNSKTLNYTKADLDKSYLRNDFFKIRLINDKTSNYNFIFKYLINNSKKSST